MESKNKTLSNEDTSISLNQRTTGFAERFLLFKDIVFPLNVVAWTQLEDVTVQGALSLGTGDRKDVELGGKDAVIALR